MVLSVLAIRSKVYVKVFRDCFNMNGAVYTFKEGAEEDDGI